MNFCMWQLNIPDEMLIPFISGLPTWQKRKLFEGIKEKFALQAQQEGIKDATERYKVDKTQETKLMMNG